MPKTVALYMIDDPATIKQDQSLDQVITLMNNTGLSHVLVKDNRDRLVGVISKEDVLKKIIQLLNETTGKTYNSYVTNSLKAFEVMTSDPIILNPEDSLEYAVELLLQNEFHCLPVVKDEHPIGIVTQYDLLKGYYQEHG